jgi:biopolymer transport protein ExbD
MSGKARSGGVKAEPNLTPILDMVFQLNTFFMLVINFKSAELDQTLNLPVVGSARPVETHGTEKLLTLNIRNEKGHPAINLYGVIIPEDEIKKYIFREAHAAMMAAKLTQEDITTGGKELPDIVIIRADETCPFGNVNYVITACQEEGFRRFALKALAQREAKK